MKIAVIGATTLTGVAIMRRGAMTGNQMTAIDENVDRIYQLFGQMTPLIAGNPMALIKEQLSSFDVIVDAFLPQPAQADQVLDLATKLIAMFRNAHAPKIIFTLGAESLLTGHGKFEHLVEQDLQNVPMLKPYLPLFQQQLQEYSFLRGIKNVNWLAISSAIDIHEGPVTPYQLGHNHVIRDDDGKSSISYLTFGKAIIDEIEKPAHHKERFTVAKK